MSTNGDLAVVVHTFTPSTREVEAEGSLSLSLAWDSEFQAR